MRVVICGATGNVGTSLIEAASRDPRVTEIVGVARRTPKTSAPKTQWVAADITRDELTGAFGGADAVVHLAWRIQPSWDLDERWHTNVIGSARIFRAVADAGVPALVYASSVGAYSKGPKESAVTESHPTHGIAGSPYSIEKAYVEGLLDTFECEHPNTRVVRLRPALVFKSEAASEIRRFFLGPLVRGPMVRPGLVPLVPQLSGLRFQAVHASDVAGAYLTAITRDVRGAFNVAADPVLKPKDLADLFEARLLPVPRKLIRGAVAATWKLRLQPADPGWFEMAMKAPLLDVSRARSELEWTPRYSSLEAVRELLTGLRGREGAPTPALVPDGRSEDAVRADDRR